MEVLDAEDRAKGILARQSMDAAREAIEVYSTAYARVPDPLLLKRAQLLTTLSTKPRRLSYETADR